ncbi:hypothetical protein AGMMS50239_29820 [Bacteroidia bacterium]|nr:hypothetical protein AGMMS50239_29820 [Bacteroidia bacterium]
MGNKRGKPLIKDIQREKKINKNKIDTLNYPIFCFKYLREISIKGSTDADFFVNFLLRLQKLSDLGWEEIRKAPKHGFGTEQIPINKLKPKDYPSIMTPDVTHLTVFRANGDNRPFLGIQNKDIFHVIFIEAKFNDIYNH